MTFEEFVLITTGVKMTDTQRVLFELCERGERLTVLTWPRGARGIHLQQLMIDEPEEKP